MEAAASLLLTNSLLDMGYTHVREVPDRGLVGLLPFIYTWGVCYGLDEDGYRGRVCFDDLASAQGFVQEWDGKELPPIGEDGVTAHK